MTWRGMRGLGVKCQVRAAHPPCWGHKSRPISHQWRSGYYPWVLRIRICFHYCGWKKKVIGESCDQTSDSTVIPSLNAQVQPQAVYFGYEQGCSFTPQVSSCQYSSLKSAVFRRGSSIWSKLQCVAYQLHLITMLPWVKSNHHPKSKKLCFQSHKKGKSMVQHFFSSPDDTAKWLRTWELMSGNTNSVTLHLCVLDQVSDIWGPSSSSLRRRE